MTVSVFINLLYAECNVLPSYSAFDQREKKKKHAPPQYLCPQAEGVNTRTHAHRNGTC